ncbi:beta-lactamase hydrolase domain-containing protein, partial [Rhizobium johnstonii]|uniref:beta-lactamase hydrolase domain-containing protein n=1 Tax=Rhizobium johnstonii TaxID=3019933 RepID=UPI003F979CE0
LEPGCGGAGVEAAAASEFDDLVDRQQAKQCDLSYEFIPVTADTITEADVSAFQRAVDESDGPVIAHCKTGKRALNLYLIGEVLDGS